ncbi:MAG: hypothetical protein PHS44_00240 [Candidatus Dojkabacteria bacterium]|nr:hypothetical protein [Candidatus Dojkabacteria bacterium]
MKRIIIGLLVTVIVIFIGISVFPFSQEGGVLASANNDDVLVPGEGDLFDEIFGPGGSIRLNILKPLNYWEGDTSIWVILSVILSNLFVILFIVLIFAIAIGAIRMVGSQGSDTKLQSASKWFKNALIGFAATIIMFILVNVVTFFLGIGTVFSLAQNLAVCNGETLFEHKRDIDEDTLPEGCDWECTPADWVCN